MSVTGIRVVDDAYQRERERLATEKANRDAGLYHGTHVFFVPESFPGRKTRLWAVYNGEVLLGQVKWHSPWRCYCFFPQTSTLFEKTCLHELAQFSDDRTYEHKGGKVRD